jgi:hypothetical protein
MLLATFGSFNLDGALVDNGLTPRVVVLSDF